MGSTENLTASSGINLTFSSFAELSHSGRSNTGHGYEEAIAATG